MLDEQSGVSTSGNRHAGVRTGMGFHGDNGDGGPAIAGSSGPVSRFFYTAKASSTDRVLGCPPGFVSKHPTVKPLAFMRYLVKLTATPTGGTVLDPFAGSGSTLVAALVEGRSCIGIEQDDENYTCCCTRADAALKYGKDLPRLKRFKLRKRRKK